MQGYPFEARGAKEVPSSMYPPPFRHGDRRVNSTFPGFQAIYRGVHGNPLPILNTPVARTLKQIQRFERRARQSLIYVPQWLAPSQRQEFFVFQRLHCSVQFTWCSRRF